MNSVNHKLTAQAARSSGVSHSHPSVTKSEKGNTAEDEKSIKTQCVGMRAAIRDEETAA